MARMARRFLQHVHHYPPEADVLPITRLPSTESIERVRFTDNAPRLFHLTPVERDHRLNGVTVADSKLSRVVTIQIDRFHILTGKRLAKPAPLDPTKMFENPKRRHTRRCRYPFGVVQGEAINFSFDHGSVPVKKSSKGFTLSSPHAQGVLHLAEFMLGSPRLSGSMAGGPAPGEMGQVVRFTTRPRPTALSR